MKTTGIFFGSSTGNTQNMAEQIAQQLGVGKAHLFDVGHVSADKLLDFDVLFLGSSTWGSGDLQDDWEGFFDAFSKQNLSGRTVAVFGTGDSSSYSDTFCDAVGILARAATAAGARVVGGTNTSGYTFDDSRAVQNGRFCGLVLDIDNEDDQTASRLNSWIQQVKAEVGL